jgi:hypothetical protein
MSNEVRLKLRRIRAKIHNCNLYQFNFKKTGFQVGLLLLTFVLPLSAYAYASKGLTSRAASTKLNKHYYIKEV